MKTSKKKLVLFGLGDLAQIANLYFSRDTNYEVVAFTVDDAYVAYPELMGLPVVPFSRVEVIYPPALYDMHVCVIYNDMNRLRARKCREAESKGYNPASYVSPHAFVAPTAKIGKHHFIFESNVIQDFVEIGDNAILWSGNHIGHNSRIGRNVFISSHVVVSGHCDVGGNVFIGVNSTLANNTVVGKESWVSHGSILSGTIPEHSMVKPVSGNTEVSPLNEPALAKALGRNKR